MVWFLWMLLLWPVLLGAKTPAAIGQEDDLLGEVSEWLALTGYDLGRLQEPAAKNSLPLPVEVSYIEAVALYVARDYENAFRAFKLLFFKEMANPKINFYLGLCAFELGDYDGAIAAYERVLFVEPGNLRCRFEMGRSYYALKMYEQAEIEFRKVLLHSTDARLIDAVKKYITTINQFRKRHFLSGSLAFGVLWDDNINNGNEHIIPILGNAPVNQKLPDYGHMQHAALSYLYDGGDKNGFFWYNRTNLYNKSYAASEAYGIVFARLQSGVQYKSSRFLFIIPLGMEYLRYGGEAYLKASDLSVHCYIPLQNRAILSLLATAKEEVNLKSGNEDFDAKTNEVTLGLLNAGGERFPGVTLHLSQKERRKNGGDESSVNTTARIFKLGYQQKLDDTLSVYPQYLYREQLFLEKQTFWFEPLPFRRHDTSRRFSIAMIYSFGADASATLGLAHTRFDSTYALYSYEKNDITLIYRLMLD
jgi:tetratricopeptide (TPR) repeat protein